MNHRVIFPPTDYWTTPKETKMTDHRRGKPPTDVVPPAPRTREQILRMNDAVGTAVHVSEPGEILTDTDGMPIGVGPTTTSSATLGSWPVYRDQLDAAGLTPEDVPNLTIIDRIGH